MTDRDRKLWQAVALAVALGFAVGFLLVLLLGCVP